MEGDLMWPRALRSRATMTDCWEPRRRSASRFFCSGFLSPVSVFFPQPVGLGRGAQPKTDQGERLSERSEFELDPVFGEHRRLPAAKRRDPDHRVAFLLGTFLW